MPSNKIDAMTFENAHLLGDALPDMMRLRYRVFIQREKYTVPSWNGMEWDQYDNPAAVYILSRGKHDRVRGVARLIPTTFPYMIKDLWPHLIETDDVPSRPDVWELTRVGVDRGLDAPTRRQVIGELVCGWLEYGLQHGIGSYLHVAHTQVIKSVLQDPGCHVDFLGQPQKLGRFPVVAAQLAVTHEALRKVRRHHGIQGPILNIAGEQRSEAA